MKGHAFDYVQIVLLNAVLVKKIFVHNCGFLQSDVGEWDAANWNIVNIRIKLVLVASEMKC